LSSDLKETRRAIPTKNTSSLKDGSKKERESEKKKVKKREGRGRDDTEVTQINSLYSRIMI